MGKSFITKSKLCKHSKYYIPYIYSFFHQHILLILFLIIINSNVVMINKMGIYSLLVFLVRYVAKWLCLVWLGGDTAATTVYSYLLHAPSSSWRVAGQECSRNSCKNPSSGYLSRLSTPHTTRYLSTCFTLALTKE